MNKLVFLSLLSILFLNCNKKEDKVLSEEKTALVEQKAEVKASINIEMIDLPISEVPKDLKYDGKLQFAKTITDQLGKHILLYALTGEVPSKKIINVDYEKDTFLYIYDYLEKDNQHQLHWNIQDNIQNCEFDLGMGFINKAITATDLDHNGLAEIWNMYHMTCTSDISPEYLKIIMYEDQKKYALRGDELLIMKYGGEEIKDGGSYKMDEAFLKSPKVFQNFAKELWEKNNRLERGY